PGLANSVHRRRYLDGLKLVKPRQATTWLSLYLRGFLRGGEYLGLYLRLLVIGAVIVAVLSPWWLALGFAILFLYMVGFQLLPFIISMMRLSLPICIRSRLTKNRLHLSGC
ncbi:hypothetical protein AAULR_14254, partial [Lacticaseibacillus rhamnosus MTCC 5462]